MSRSSRFKVLLLILVNFMQVDKHHRHITHFISFTKISSNIDERSAKTEKSNCVFKLIKFAL